MLRAAVFARIPRSVWVVAALTLALHLACLGGYGYFRDELYFIACGRHLAWGYVDQPPLVAVVARASELASFGSLALFRLPANLAHAALVVVAADLARRLGAGPFGATVAAIGAAAAPVFLANGGLLTMNAFEPLFVAAVVDLVVAILDGADARAWIAAGALVGVGALNKHSMLFFAACLVVALVATARGRSALASRWALAGAAVAALLLAPHAIWQVRAHFPMLELLRNGQAHKNAPFTLVSLWKGQLLEMNLGALPLIVGAALAALSSSARATTRVVVVTALLAEALFTALKAKPYYLAPIDPLLFAAGAAAIERFGRARFAVPALVVAFGALAAPAALPLLPVTATERYLAALGVEPPRLERMRYRVLPQHLADQFGWPEMTGAVAEVYARLPSDERARAAIVLSNYGEAGALDFFGASRGLPPASSGHNEYFRWGLHGDGSVLVVVGGVVDELRPFYGRVERAGETPPNPHGLPSEDARPIWVLRDPNRAPDVVWAALRSYI